MEGGWRKGPWTAEEDRLLVEYVKLHGEGRWNSVASFAGLKRNGKSCRLRWVNYLRPDLKRGRITPYEETIILHLHATWGNRWSTIARSLPGRTDNEIKNYWRTHFKKKGKPCSHNSEKLRPRLLKRQPFQHQQQLLLLQQQDQITNMEKIVSLCYESDTKMPSSFVESSHELGQTNTLLVEQEAVLPEAPHDLSVCDGLWSMDDLFGTNSISRAIYQQTLASHLY